MSDGFAFLNVLVSLPVSVSVSVCESLYIHVSGCGCVCVFMLLTLFMSLRTSLMGQQHSFSDNPTCTVLSTIYFCDIDAGVRPENATQSLRAKLVLESRVMLLDFFHNLFGICFSRNFRIPLQSLDYYYTSF